MVGQRDYFELDEIVEELRDQGLRFPKTIIYVPTMDTGSSIYNYFYRKLRRSMIIDVTKLVMFYYAMAGEGTLAFIQEEFTGLDSGIRVLIATIAYGMRVDVKGVKRVVHWGGSKNALSYWQEVGRAGRDGSYCECTMFYIPAIMRLVKYDEKLHAALRNMANLPEKRLVGPPQTFSRASQTETSYPNKHSHKPEILSDAKCNAEPPSKLPCFRRYLLFSALWLRGMKIRRE